MYIRNVSILLLMIKLMCNWNEPKNFIKFWKWEDGKTNEQDKRRMETQVTRWVANKQTLERTAFWPN